MLSYSLTVALNYQNVENNIQRISKIKLFIDQCNWKEIDLSYRKNWKKFELSNKLVTVKILYVPYNIEEIKHACKSKYDLQHENQVILLIITDDKK